MSHQANGAGTVKAEDHVPILALTADIPPRLKTLTAHFISKYYMKPAFFARMPGR